MQEGTLDPSALAPVARLMSAGAILYRADLQTDRYDLVRAAPLWRLLTDPVPAGLSDPQKFGDSLGAPLRATQDDELQLAMPADATEPPPVSVFTVDGAPAIVRSSDASAPIVVSGDGEGLVDLATIGALDGSGVVLYAATFADDPARLKSEVAQPNSVLVVTDSNRKRARRWTSIRDTAGETERVDQTALTKDENDNRLDVFPDAGTDAQTVVQTPGVAVSTSRYGDPGSYQPEYRGSRAFDGDTSTQWEVGAHTKVIGQQLRLDLDQPITTGEINLVQPLVGPTLRYLTRVELRFDGGDADHRRPHRRVAHGRRPDRDVPVTDLPPTRRHDRRHQRGRRVGAAVLEQRRVRRDPPQGRRARLGVRARRRDRAHAHRPGRRRGLGGRGPTARVPDDPAAHDRGPAALLAGRGGVGAPVPGARRPPVRDRGHRPAGCGRTGRRDRRGARHPERGQRRDHGHVVAAPSRRPRRARLVGVRR